MKYKKLKIKKICFDIDGIICSTNKNHDYNKSKPIKKNIEVINKLHEAGYEIVLHTARYMGRFHNNRIKAEKKIKKHTLKQLSSWNVKYSKIFFGKPSFDLVIDDKSLFFNKKWNLRIKKYL